MPPGLRVSGLHSWSAVELRRRRGRLHSARLLRGSSAAEFWERVAAYAASGAPIRIISPRALMAWQTLELWQLVERGQIRARVGGAVRARPDGTLERVPASSCLVTSDPPTIGDFELADGGSRITWVCAGNYGLQEPVAGLDSDGEANRLAESVMECDSVMREHELGGWALTATGIAWRGWLGSYDGPGIYLSGGGAGDALENEARYGGVVLARPTGEATIEGYAVDARSQYPWIAAHYPQATTLLQRGLVGAAAAAAVAADPQCCLARVRLRGTDGRWPMRPGRPPPDVGGTVTATLPGPELAVALKRGCVLDVLAANVYETGLPLASYQRRVWQARTECAERGLDAAGRLVKRLGVGLIGKLAQRVEEWGEIVPDLNDPVWGSWHHLGLNGEVRRMRARGGVVEMLWRRSVASHSVPSIPISIWSWGRLRMWNWIERAGIDNVWYADTDGLIVTREGAERLGLLGAERSDQWGALRIVSGPVPCRIRGVRDVEIGGRVVKAGLATNGRDGLARLEGPAWYRLPWTEAQDHRWCGSWVERSR